MLSKLLPNETKYQLHFGVEITQLNSNKSVKYGSAQDETKENHNNNKSLYDHHLIDRKMKWLKNI